MQLTQHQKEPVKTASGRVWAQNCYLCNRQIDLLRDPRGVKWIRVLELVRHRKCSPEALR